jgi:glycosyltransferase involved in cell wall biosynthesis
MPVVSVIIPAYNAKKTILETIQSVQAQTLTDLEMIVVNDGSTDATLDALKAIDDSRLKVVSQANAGQAIARNHGMAQAAGAYLSFLDADDVWTPTKLERQWQALQDHPEAGVAYSWTAFINEHSEEIYRFAETPYEGDVYPQLLLENFIASGSNILVRRECAEAIGGFDPIQKSAEDWDYCLRLAARYPFVRVPSYDVLYRRSSTSETARVADRVREGLAFVDRMYQTVPANYQPLKRITLSRANIFYANLYLSYYPNRLGASEAIPKLWAAIRQYPQSLLTGKVQRLLAKTIVVSVKPVMYKRSVKIHEIRTIF